MESTKRKPLLEINLAKFALTQGQNAKVNCISIMNKWKIIFLNIKIVLRTQTFHNKSNN